MLRNPFTGERIRDGARKRDRKEHDRRKRDRARLARPIVAWDGEGLAVPAGEPQPYVLLANSAGGEWTGSNGLSTLRCFDALLSGAAANRNARHVAFGLSYDANQWLRDLPEPKLRELWKTGAVWWGDYRIEYRPRRTFALKQRYTGRSIMVWDVQTWFGGGLADAIAAWLPRFEHRALVRRMKARRRLFTWGELDQVRAYTRAELAATVQLTQALLAELTELGIRPARLDGPGGAAAFLLHAHGVKAQLGAPLSRDLNRAAHIAFAGGRIEPVRFGTHQGALWEYDLHGAYPWAMAQLPGLADVEWEYERGNPGGDRIVDHVLYRVRWRPVRSAQPGHSQWYPFPWRDRTGGIYYPSAGESWIWGAELAAYLAPDVRRLFDCDAEIVGAFRPHGDALAARPFAWLRDLYRARVAAGPHGGELVKASMNACYGKLVQAVGWRHEPPPYYSIVWGGLTTALVRARLLRAAAKDPGAVVMFATDALFTTRRLRLGADLGDELGQWGEQQHQGGTIVQSGVYLLGDALVAARGYSPRRLGATPAGQVRKLRALVERGWAREDDAIDIPQERFVSMASYLEAGPPAGPAWRSWVTEPVKLDLWPTGKRTHAEVADPLRRLVRSAPTPVVENLAARPRMASAYARTWKPSLQTLSEGVAPVSYEEEIEEAVI